MRSTRSPPTTTEYVPKRTIFDAFNKTSHFPSSPEIGFGTGSRPPLSNPNATPGPGTYPIKTTIGKVMESHIKSPCQYSIRSRTLFGNPNAKAMSKSNATEPGPGQYDVKGKFPRGKDPAKISFPKGTQRAPAVNTANRFMPGPGAYGTVESMGHQSLSTKKDAPQVGFAKSERGTFGTSGTGEVGPGEYSGAYVAACEVKQVESTKASCPKVKFGTEYKKRGGSTGGSIDMSEPSPGPCSYVLPSVIGGKDSIKASLSGRNKFGSPFG